MPAKNRIPGLGLLDVSIFDTYERKRLSRSAGVDYDHPRRDISSRIQFKNIVIMSGFLVVFLKIFQ